MGISYFSVVSLRQPSDKMLLFLFCAKIKLVKFRVPFILLTKPIYNIWVVLLRIPFIILTNAFYNIWVSHIDPFTIFGYLIFQCSFTRGTFWQNAIISGVSKKVNVVSFRVPFILLTKPFYNIWVSHIDPFTIDVYFIFQCSFT